MASAMRRRVLLIVVALACVALFCSQFFQRDGSKGLGYVAIGIDEDHSPVVLGIKVRNNTDEAIEITGCSAQLLYNSLVAGDFTPQTMPPSFSPEVTFIDATPVVLPANSTAIVQLGFDWDLDDSLPPAAVACQVVPILQTEVGSVTTEPVAFVVTHNAEGVGEAGGFQINASESSARDFLQSMEEFDGKRSGRIQFLIKALRERLNGTAQAFPLLI